MKRLIEKIVFSGLVVACRLATCPTSRSPSFEKATTDGVNRPPSALGTTTGSPASMMAITELVVPRSIPRTFGTSYPPKKKLSSLSSPKVDLLFTVLKQKDSTLVHCCQLSLQ